MPFTTMMVHLDVERDCEQRVQFALALADRFQAAGPTDIVARIVAEQLSKIWGQQVVIENRGGAGTNIGNEIVARSDPDGYTVLFATASLAVNRSLYRSLSYDPIADPPEIVKKMSLDTIAALADPMVKGKLEQAGYMVVGSPPNELQTLLTSEIDKWSAVIRTVGIKIN